MYTLVSDGINNIVSLYKDFKLISTEYERNYSCYNEYPVFSIKSILSRFNIDFSQIDHFLYVGTNRSAYNAILNLNLLELYDHINRKEIINIKHEHADIFYSYKESGFSDSVGLIWDRNGIRTYSITKSGIMDSIFSVDENLEILRFTQIIIDFAGENFYSQYIIKSFNQDLSLYHVIKEKCFDFNPDGRVYINNDLFKELIEKNREKENIFYTVKKLIDDILIHVSNYVKYLTKVNYAVYSGEFSRISLANSKMSTYIPFEKHYIDLTPIDEFITQGAINIFRDEILNMKDDQEEEKNVKDIILKLFSDFHSEDINKISKYFYYMDDQVFMTIKDNLEKCENIKINFVLKDITLSSSRLKSWGLFYFYFFGNYRESKQPVILNFKCMLFLKKENGNWNIGDLEFYNFDNLPILTIELSNSCNYKCIMCDTNMQKSKAFMSVNTFRNIIDSLEDFRVGTITPFWLGEPLMNPDFVSMLEYAFEKNENNRKFVSFTINTNASLLDKEKTEAILKAASKKNMNANTFIRVHFSIDSVFEKTYRKIHGAGSFEIVKKNILYFIKRRKELDLEYPKLTFALIVMKENFDEVNDFVGFWREELEKTGSDFYITYDWPYLEKDAIYIRRLDSKDQHESEKMHYQAVKNLGMLEEQVTEEEQEPEIRNVETGGEHEPETKNVEIGEDVTDGDVIDEAVTEKVETIETVEEEVEEYSGRLINTDSVLIKNNLDYFTRRPCPALWKTPIINWNGEVTTCCFDIDLLLKIGNINDKALKDLWEGELLKKWRIYHLRGDFNKIGRCSLCANINSPTMKNSEFIEYLINLGKKDEVEKAHFLD